MKKLMVSILLGCLLLQGCTSGKNKPLDTSKMTMIDIASAPADMSGYHLLKDTQHMYEATTIKEFLRVFKEKGTAVVYFGYVGCPFCEQAVPVLNEVAKEKEMKVYYISVDHKFSDEEYDEFIENTKDFLRKDKDGNPEFYVPQVFTIKDGVIVGSHLSLVDSYNTKDGNLTQSQHDELKQIYVDMFEKLR